MKLVLVALLFYFVTPLRAQIDILEERQLFVDDFIVETSESLDYKLHFSIEVSKNDLPYGYYQTVIKQDKDKYFLYYRDYFDNYNMERFDANFGEVTRLKHSENRGKD
jgi:wobble nucleotide-excising tRNase